MSAVRRHSAAAASRPATSVAIVGSGAIAAVLAQHLTIAGDDVTFVVRNPGSPNARQPRPIRRLRSFRPGLETARQELPVASTVPPDTHEVWLCTASNAVSDPWLRGLLGRLPREMRVLSWLPGAGIADELRDQLPRGLDLAQGEVSFLSFQAPLSNEIAATEGIAYWTPGLGAMLDGSRAGRNAAQRLRRGGLPAIVLPGFDICAPALAAFTTVAVAVLEIEGWNRDAFRRRGERMLAARAIRQASQSGATRASRRRGDAGERLVATALWVLPRLPRRALPFDLDAYLEFHFSKVGEQTRHLLRRWAEHSARGGTRPAELDLVIRRLTTPDTAEPTRRTTL